MLIQWTSDDVTTESGWSASWSSVVVGGSLHLRPSPRTNLYRRLPRSPFPKPIRLAKTRDAAALPAPSAGASACSGSPCSAGSYGAAGTPAAVVARAHGTPALCHDLFDGTTPARGQFTDYIAAAHGTCMHGRKILMLTPSPAGCRSWISS
jgi:hypothetical protein